MKMKISEFFVQLDKIADHIPIVSTISNATDLFLKIFIPNSTPPEKTYRYHLQEKSKIRCALLLIPGVNIVVALSENSIKKTFTENHFRKTNVDAFNELKRDQSLIQSLGDPASNEISDLMFASEQMPQETYNAIKFKLEGFFEDDPLEDPMTKLLKPLLWAQFLELVEEKHNGQEAVHYYGEFFRKVSQELNSGEELPDREALLALRDRAEDHLKRLYRDIDVSNTPPLGYDPIWHGPRHHWD
ncbi:MAG: hypothetical protein K0S07_758 [Chlamydiales bacterium]|jgi:hypothetical protein|nr:hypothetical protein [Chlamydiales bacterium]